MPIELTPRTVSHPHRAKYLQITDAFRAAIADGYLADGETLPSEDKVGQLVGVSKGTARAAFDALELAGLIERRNGKPSRVIGQRQMRVISADQYGEVDRRIAAGMTTEGSSFTRGHHIAWGDHTADVEIRLEEATPHDLELLQLPAHGGSVWRRFMLLYVGDKETGGQPLEIQRSAIPLWVAERAPHMVAGQDHPYADGLQRELADGGLRPTRIEHKLTAGLPTEQEKGDLQIAQVPVIRIERVFYWTDERGGELPVAASRQILPASRHEVTYTVKLP